MNHFFLLTWALLLLAACVPNGSQSPGQAAAVQLRVLNATGEPLDDVEIRFPNQTERFGPLNPMPVEPAVSEYRLINGAYRYAAITARTGGRSLVLQPTDYVGEQYLPDGDYTYVLQKDGGQLLLTLVDDGAAAPQGLQGERWYLEAVVADGRSTTTDGLSQRPWLSFTTTAEGAGQAGYHLAGYGGCNQLEGSYLVGENDALLLLGLFQTERDCDQGMDVEAIFTTELNQLLYYELTGEDLTVSGLNGSQLIFSR